MVDEDANMKRVTLIGDDGVCGLAQGKRRAGQKRRHIIFRLLLLSTPRRQIIYTNRAWFLRDKWPVEGPDFPTQQGTFPKRGYNCGGK